MAQVPVLLHCPTCGGMVASNAPSCPHCGYRPPLAARTNSLNMPAAVILIGGALVAIGSFLPWATATGLNYRPSPGDALGVGDLEGEDCAHGAGEPVQPYADTGLRHGSRVVGVAIRVCGGRAGDGCKD